MVYFTYKLNNLIVVFNIELGIFIYEIIILNIIYIFVID